MTPARFRRRDRQHWRPGNLHRIWPADAAGQHDVEPRQYVVELTDTRTGGSRTLSTGLWQIEVSDRGRWRPLATWVGSTPELFDARGA